jgi:hypothetical protein
MFGPIGGLVGNTIVGPGQMLLAPWRERLTWKTWWRIRHAGWVVDQHRGTVMIGQAMAGGFEIVRLRAGQWSPDYVFIRPRWRSEDQGARLAGIAHQMVEKRIKYGFPTYARLAAHKSRIPTPHLDRWVERVDADGYPREAICSQANDFALTRSGGLTESGEVFTDGRAHHDVIPSALYLRLLALNPVAVCRPGKVLVSRQARGLTGIGSIPADLL